jgi:hypothetical protein
VLPNTALDKIYKIRSIKVIKIVIRLFKKLIIEEDKLCVEYKIKSKALQKIMDYVVNDEIVSRVLIDNSIYYSLNYRFLNKEIIKCKECKHSKTNKKEYNGKIIRIIDCDKKCEFYKILEMRNCLKLMMITAKEIGIQEEIKVYNEKKNKEKKKDFDKWDYRDFTIYVEELYNEYSPDFIISKDFRNHIIKNIKSIIKYVRTVSDSNWRKNLRLYIYNQFVDTNGKVSIKILADKNVMKENLNKITDYMNKVEFCKIKGVHCKYMKNKICMVIKDGNKCTSKIRKYMQEKYG